MTQHLKATMWGRRAFLFSSLASILSGCGRKPRVVLYCAQDEEFAVDILSDFTRRTGLEVAPRFDDEASKTVSLYEELVREKDRVRCDVFWNNEFLATIRLQRQGLLQPYSSPSSAGFPKDTKSADDTWQAFAARARVFIVNTKNLPEKDRPRGLLDLVEPRWKGRLAMAKPMFGTTATQAACLFEVLGNKAGEAYYRDLHRNDIAILPGNKDVAVAVAAGRYDVGMTDTDDAIGEVAAGKPVAIVFPDRAGSKEHPRLGTLFIPNTVSILRNAPNPEAARRLVDFLLSAEVEAKLAEASCHQIPLNPKVDAKLSEQIETPKTAKAMQVDFTRTVDLWDETRRFLIDEFGA